MANSRFNYHKQEEKDLDVVFEPRFYIIIRLELDKHETTGHHESLIKSAKKILELYHGHIVITHISDCEVNFVINSSSDLFNRRKSKIISMISVIFWTRYANYVRIYRSDYAYSTTVNEYGDFRLAIAYIKWRESTNRGIILKSHSNYKFNEDNIDLIHDTSVWTDNQFFHNSEPQTYLPSLAQSENQFFTKYELDSIQRFSGYTYVIIRIDGHKFHEFSSDHQFHKPNDKRALDLMVESAKLLMTEFRGHIPLAYGDSDEFSFLLRSDSNLLSRDISRILSVFPTKFSLYYNKNWERFFNDPSSGETISRLRDAWFDAKARKYPDFISVINYFKWRQADCHINNLYNTTLHALTGRYRRHKFVKVSDEEALNPNQVLYTDGRGDLQVYKLITTPISEWMPKKDKFLSSIEATKKLNGTISKDKHDILFNQFGVNYNDELEQFKKGTIILDLANNKNCPLDGSCQVDLLLKHYSVDITKNNDFWLNNSHIFQYFDCTLFDDKNKIIS